MGLTRASSPLVQCAAVLLAMLGVAAAYSLPSDEPCGTVSGVQSVTAPSGLLADGYSSSYSNSITCRWHVAPSAPVDVPWLPVHRMAVYFSSFRTESGSDTVEIATDSGETFTFSGSDLPDALLLSTTAFTVVFRTDASVSRNGFILGYVAYALGVTSTVAEMDTELAMQPSSYAFVRLPVFQTHSGMRVSMRRVGSSSSFRGYLAHGYLPSSGSYDKYRSFTSSGSLTSSSEAGDWYLALRHTSSSERTVRVTFSFTGGVMSGGSSSQCITNVLTRPSNEFDDGSGGSSYANDLDCTYEVAPVPAPAFILLSFVSFNTERRYDELHIYTDSDDLGTYSGSNKPGPFLVRGSKVKLHFTTDGSVRRSGWTAAYESVSYPAEVTDLGLEGSLTRTLSQGQTAYYSLFASMSSEGVDVTLSVPDASQWALFVANNTELPSASNTLSGIMQGQTSISFALAQVLVQNGSTYVIAVERTQPGSAAFRLIATSNTPFWTVGRIVGLVLGLVFGVPLSVVALCCGVRRCRKKCNKRRMQAMRGNQRAAAKPAAAPATTASPASVRAAAKASSLELMSQASTDMSQFAGCQLRGCNQARSVDTRTFAVANFCSPEHAVWASEPSLVPAEGSAPVCSLPGCMLPRATLAHQYCCQTHENMDVARRMAVPLVPLERGSYEWLVNEQQWRSTWLKGTAPGIKVMFRVNVSAAQVQRFDKYRAEVVVRNPFVYKFGAPGNVQKRWHGTSAACGLGLNGNVKLCNMASCRACHMIKDGFDIAFVRRLNHWARFGPGHYLSATSSKSAEYPLSLGAREHRVMFMVRAVVGRGYRTKTNAPTMKGPPSGYDSVLGEVGSHLNYDETVLYRDDAVMARYLLISE